MMNAGRTGHELVQHMHALHQHLSEAARIGDFAAELEDMTIAVEPGAGPDSMEFLIVAGHPMIWLRATSTAVVLIGSFVGQSHRMEIDVPRRILAELHNRRW